MMIHDFDMAPFILHDEITHLSAMGQCLFCDDIALVGDVDTAIVSFQYKGGL